MSDEELVDELTALVLDDLAPALAWYRVQVAGRLDLSVTELTCLELCRAGDPTPSSRIAECTGLTRSTVAKLLRRWEEQGHVERLTDPDEQEVTVRPRPHERRDLMWAELRSRVRRSLRDELPASRLETAIPLLHALYQLVFRHARQLGDAAAWRRVVRARRRARAGITPWWER